MRDGMKTTTLRIFGAIIAALIAAPAVAETANEPWKREELALVIDAYEYNPIDWESLSEDERIAGFINKASDGLPPKYRCSGKGMEYDHCRLAWKRYSVTKELYHTRKMMAKSLGYVWGAYHLGRPGNPEHQADHFLEFADPQDDELIAIDIEDNDPEKFMSLADAEIFARRIKSRTGRWPVLYTNGSTSEYIAHHANDYPILSRLQIWYARYRNEIEGVFPLGNWENYALWQFASHINCKGKSSCPYRPLGTQEDIDVNVAPMGKLALQKAWPFGELQPKRVPDEVLVASNDADEEKTEKTGEEASTPIEIASVDSDLVSIPLPMRSPRDPAPAATTAVANSDGEMNGYETQALAALADVTRSKTSDVPSSLAAFTVQPGLKRTASQALANFASGKKNKIGPAYAEAVPASAKPIVTPRRQTNSSVPVEKTTVAALPKSDPATYGVGFAKHPLRTADLIAEMNQVPAKVRKKKPMTHAETVTSRRMTKASILSTDTMEPKARSKSKAAAEKGESTGFLSRVGAIIEATPKTFSFR